MTTDHLQNEHTVLNLGPSHPAMHGTLRLYCELDGETIKRAVPEFGYLHRGFEKHAENSTYTQVIPYTDRLNYVSAMMNNVGYVKAVEELMEIEIPERVKVIRVIICEMNRILDHLVCTGTNIVDIGALTNFWYYFNVREKFYNIIEKLCG
ncbi:MAG: NADH-quinone oxidoreductase subunit D, partial [Deltaproteobacteria bacterium]|nr:NADH-quinone oxidoreductase subunit D [Deltaproteobacteria bacterium]